MMAKKKREKFRYVGPILFILCLILPKLSDGTTCSLNDSSNTTDEEIDPGKQNFVNSCGWDFKKRWPANPNGPTLVLGFLMTRRGFHPERLGLKIPGMMSYAIEEVNKAGILPENYTLQVEVRDIEGDPILSTKYLTNLLCDKISGIIGPETSCWIEANIAEAQNIPMISYACTDDRATHRKTFARTNPSEIHILNATIQTLIFFKWKRFSIIYSKPSFESMAKTIEKEALKQNLTINHKIAFEKVDEFPSIFVKTKDETRIYVLLSHRQVVSKALLAMTLSGLLKANKKNYFLIHVDKEEFKPENWVDYIFDPTTVDQLNKTNKCLFKDLKAYEDSFMVIANTLPTNTGCIEKKTRDYNKREPFCLASDVTKVLNRNRGTGSHPLTTQHVPFLPASHLFDAVMLYAMAVSELYKELNDSKPPNVTLDVQEIGRNGTGIAQKLVDRTFHSILGYNIIMGSDRASKGNYSVYYFKEDVKCQNATYSALPNCSSHCLVKLSDFRNGSLEINETIDIVDMPVCGYNNECEVPSTGIRLIILIVLATSVFLLSLISFLHYRHWKYEQEISGLSWRINKDELKLHIKNYISQSRISITSVDCNFQTMLSNERMAEYRGTTCCLKFIDLDSKKQDLSRKLMKQMKAMREIKHRNVCAFIGAYVHDRRLTLVSEYANRGSLEDIMQNPEIKLDDLFISSLVQDLLRAMTYLHNSFGPHGNLKSNNCVVTGRWVLQVADYDLHEVRYETIKSLMKEPGYKDTPEWEMYRKSLLWRAPELLRLDPVPGTREGDVYSFGIILHEIIARQGPFSTYDVDYVNYDELIEEIISGSNKSGSLRRPDILDMFMKPFGLDPDVKAAMESAWAEDPKTRPDFKELSTRLKKMKKSQGNLVDHMVDILEGHNKNLEERVAAKTCELREEKKRSEELLHSMLPEEVARSICSNISVPPKSFDSVTIYFSDIVGFTALASESSPIQIFQFLDDLYKEFDNTIRGFDVYKVETIGDAYMVVSGLPDSKKKVPHAGAIASMALELLEKTKSFKIRHIPDQSLKLRIGLHTGPVIAGVVGRTMPRYCLFGDTVNMASRMESNGAPLRIHISEECKEALTALGGYVVERRDKISVKGKGEVQTYWLNDVTEGAIKRKEPDPELPPEPTDLRRRSPKLSLDLRTPRIGHPRRTSSVIRSSICGEEDIDWTARSQTPPIDLGELHFRRLSNCLKASSLESPRRLLSLPNDGRRSRSPSTSSFRESHSLDRIPPATDLPTPLDEIDDTQPCPSDPIEGAPKVNFRDDDANEGEPMLDYIPDDLEGSESSGAKRASLKTFFQALFPKAKRERLNSEKSSLNGLQRESHV